MSTVGPLAISTVTVVEVVKGFRKVGREQEIDRFLASLPKLGVFALDAVAAGGSTQRSAGGRATGQL
jgi:hypothetical protein